MIRQIAIIISGDDAPGMNAAIRGVTLAAADQTWDVVGLRLDGDAFHGIALSPRRVDHILRQSGSILPDIPAGTFQGETARKHLLNDFADDGIDAAIVIGGNEAQVQARALLQAGLPVVGIAASVDNDVTGTDMAIGVDTALNLSVHAIDRLRTSAARKRCCFVVEVSGRDCGYLALTSAIATGADAALVPEEDMTGLEVADAVRGAYGYDKLHAVVVVSEGARCGADAVAALAADEALALVRPITRLGHVQRAGTPSAFDRILATRMGACAVSALASGHYGTLLGCVHEGTRTAPFYEVVDRQRAPDTALRSLLQILAR